MKKGEDIAGSTLLPSIGLTANVNYVDLNVQSGPASDDDYDTQDLSVSLTQPVFRRDRWLAVDQAKFTSAVAD